MNKSFLIAFAFIATVNVMAQDNDPVIMNINGKDIKRSEFEYSYNKNNSEGVIDKKDVHDYVQLYVDYKLKVEAAKDAGIDTLTNIRTELQGYREQIVYPNIENPLWVEDQAYKTYLNTAQHYGDTDLLTCQHILVLLKQDADEKTQQAAKQTIDSIYQCVLAGEDFGELAKKHSQDPGSAQNGGQLPKFGKGRMIPEFENAAYALEVGEISEPVKTAAGWHIIKMNERGKFEPYEFHHDAIVKFLNQQQGFRDAAAEAYIDSVANTEGVTKDVVFQRLFDEMTSKDDEAKNLAQEYYDGTLMFEASKTMVWDKAQNDKDGLNDYFKKNKKKYQWTEPHFRGVVVHAKEPQYINQAKKMVKGVDQAEWANKIVALNTTTEKVVRVEKLGVFKKGDNRFVDKHAFKTADELKEYNEYPYSDIIGKMLKKPQSFEDVRGQVVADYQKEKENEWVNALRVKYPVKVNWDVVDTVNNH